MRRNLLLLVVAVLLGLGAHYLYNAQPPAPPAPAPQASAYPMAPDFSYTQLDGKLGQLSDHRGKIVLLNFWASWCAPCKVEFPQFITLAGQREDVVILAVSVDHNAQAMQRFLDEYGRLPSNFIIAHDPKKAIALDLFQTLRYPETILIGPDGSLRRKFVGLEVKWDAPDFISSLAP